jgi:hypothetical protein
LASRSTTITSAFTAAATVCSLLENSRRCEAAALASVTTLASATRRTSAWLDDDAFALWRGDPLGSDALRTTVN